MWNDSVAVIDGASDIVITTIPTGDEPLAFAWNPMQNRTYVANFSSSSISVIRDNIGIEENNSHSIEKADFSATIFNGPLQLPKDRSCRVFDITGRQVMLDNMKPGIYFIEVDGTITQKVVKVK